MSWQRQRLPGGLLLSQQQRSNPGLLAARLWMAGGSSLDPSGQRGAHQLLAGLLTRGCGNLDAEALADLVEGRGAALRAEAGEDNLTVSLKCAQDDAEVLLPLLLQMVAQSHLANDQIEIERQLNLQALQRQREDPFQLCHEGLRSQLYGDGPYGHDPLGVEAELEGLGRDDLQTLQQQLGRPGAVLVLAGTLPANAGLLLEQTLVNAPWTVNTHEADTELPAAASAATPPQLIEQDTEQVVLMLGCNTVPLGHPDNLPLRLLQVHLGLGMSSHLFVTIREERGLAYDVGVHMPARRRGTPLIWHLSTSCDRAAEATTALLDSWEQLGQDHLSADALALARAKYLGQDAFGQQTCGQWADRQALLLGFGLPDDFIEHNLQRAAQLQADELLAVAQRQLPRPQLCLCGPAAGLKAAAQAWERHRLGGAASAQV